MEHNTPTSLKQPESIPEEDLDLTGPGTDSSTPALTEANSPVTHGTIYTNRKEPSRTMQVTPGVTPQVTKRELHRTTATATRFMQDSSESMANTRYSNNTSTMQQTRGSTMPLPGGVQSSNPQTSTISVQDLLNQTQFIINEYLETPQPLQRQQNQRQPFSRSWSFHGSTSGIRQPLSSPYSFANGGAPRVPVPQQLAVDQNNHSVSRGQFNVPQRPHYRDDAFQNPYIPPPYGVHGNAFQHQRDFTAPDVMSDMILLVEGHRLHVHKQYLAEWSRVWRNRIQRDMRDPLEMELPGKGLFEMTELLNCIYSTQKPISDSNVGFLLELSEEFEIEQIRFRCEQFLITQEPSLRNLLLSQVHDMPKLYEKCINYAKGLEINHLEQSMEFSCLSPDVVAQIYRARLLVLEQNARKPFPQESQQQKRMSILESEISQMKAVLDQIPKLWDLSPKKCFRHMHLSHFDFTCGQCNQKVQLEIKRLCSDGRLRRTPFMNNSQRNSLTSSMTTISSKVLDSQKT